MASKELKIGDKAPSFDMPTDGGGTVSLAGRNVADGLKAAKAL